jgi:hypothetical protein
MTDNQKLLCTLLSETEPEARKGVPEIISPLRMVCILRGRRRVEPELAV